MESVTVRADARDRRNVCGRCDGAPYASAALGSLSQLAVWWIKLGIEPERIQAGHRSRLAAEAERKCRQAWHDAPRRATWPLHAGKRASPNRKRLVVLLDSAF